MIRKRLTRALASSGLALTLVMTLLAVPAATLAAVPNWSGSSVSLPATVKPGSNAGYELTIHNSGPSNISQLYLVTTGSAPNPAYSQPSQGTCTNDDGPLYCSLGALNADSDATVIVAFPTPTTGTSFSVQFEFNTTGLGSGGPDNDSSHGDSLPVTGTTALSADSTNFAGGFVVGSGAEVANAAISGAGNKQSTRLFSPSSAIPVTVEDGPGAASPCPAGFTGCVLETSEIHVGDGTDQYGIFKVVIQIDKTALNGLSLNKLVVIHVPDVGPAYEITTACPKNGTPTQECATISKLPGGHGQVTIWLQSNGAVKFH